MSLLRLLLAIVRICRLGREPLHEPSETTEPANLPETAAWRLFAHGLYCELATSVRSKNLWGWPAWAFESCEDAIHAVGRPLEALQIPARYRVQSGLPATHREVVQRARVLKRPTQLASASMETCDEPTMTYCLDCQTPDAPRRRTFDCPHMTRPWEPGAWGRQDGEAKSRDARARCCLVATKTPCCVVSKANSMRSAHPLLGLPQFVASEASYSAADRARTPVCNPHSQVSTDRMSPAKKSKEGQNRTTLPFFQT